MLFKNSLLFMSLTICSAIKLEYTDCGRKEVKEVRSSTCPADPCRVPIGGTAEVEVDFIPRINAENVTIAVFATVFGFEMALPLHDTDGCKDGRLSCPIVKGKPHTFKYRLDVDDSYFPVSGEVGFRLNHKDEAIACATFSAELYNLEDEEKHQEL